MTYEEYCRLYEELEQKAMELLKELHDIDPIHGFDWLSVDGIDKDEIFYTGTETWRYGGYEDHSFEISTKCLFDEQAWQDEVNNRALRREMREQKAIKLAEEDKIQWAENRRQLYEKLRKEFENEL